MLDLADAPGQWEVDRWPELRVRLEATFASKTRDEWAAVFEGRPACVTPVLSLTEARTHPHLSERAVVVDVDGVPQPAPAPRFSRTPAEVPTSPSDVGADTRSALAAWGLTGDEMDALAAANAI